MTRDEILNMEAGRTMNALIADTAPLAICRAALLATMREQK